MLDVSTTPMTMHSLLALVDMLYYSAFQQMRIERERLVWANAPLVGFEGMKVYPFEVVTLPVTVNNYP